MEKENGMKKKKILLINVAFLQNKLSDRCCFCHSKLYKVVARGMRAACLGAPEFACLVSTRVWLRLHTGQKVQTFKL